MFTYLDDRGSSRYSRAAVAASRRAALAMTTIIVLLLVSLYACGDRAALTSPPAPAPSATVAAPTVAARPVPGQYIVTFARDVSDVPGLAKQLVAQSGGRQLFTYTSALRGFAARMSPQAAAALTRNPNVVAVEQDATIAANDVQSPAPWGLDRIDQRSTSLDNTYASEGTGAGVSVYIIDSGIRTTHQDFGGRAFGAYTAVSDGNGTNDCTGHGTFVAGVVAGATYGVAKGANVYGVRVFDCSGNATSSAVLAGVDWVTANARRPAVANMSLGGAVSSALNTAVANSINSGITYAVSAGNSSADACTQSPASVPAALTVASVNSIDAQPSWSNYGSCVDLYAPGVSVRSSWYTSDTSTTSSSGTSVSAPFVAGAAALYLGGHPSASAAEVAQAIVSTATSGTVQNLGAGSPSRVLYTGGLTAAAAPASPPPVDTAAPAVVSAAPDQPPVASFTINCSKGACNANASASSDDHGIALYTWSFGDGTPSVSGSAATANHSYRSRGSYTVTLTVTDTAGHTATVARGVTIKRV